MKSRRMQIVTPEARVRTVRPEYEWASLRIAGRTICFAAFADKHPYNCLAANNEDWLKETHYCGMPLDHMLGALDRLSFAFFPAGSASDAWVEWRMTGLVRVVMVHEDAPSCIWSLGTVWEGGR